VARAVARHEQYKINLMLYPLRLAVLSVFPIVWVARPPAPTRSPGQTAGPGVRNAHVLVYDASRERVVLFAGADEARVRDDTWEWDGGAWRLVTTQGPGPRTFPGAAYDYEHGGVLLFGGNRVLFGTGDQGDTFLGDTWWLKEGKWSRRDVEGPPARAEAAMAYDRRRQRVVLFGGYYRTAGSNVRLGDTWEWDGARWRRISTNGPPPRSGLAVAYDESRERVVTFGGSGRSNETWAWDGSAWRRVPSGGPEPRFNAALTYSLANGALLRFGGFIEGGRTADTWLLDGDLWRRLEVPGPPARNHAAMAFDARRGRAVLFGGHDGDRVFGDTWEWNGRSWREAASVPARRRVENGH
jgi:hypothetical protein